jgi:hypothetical protein
MNSRYNFKVDGQVCLAVEVMTEKGEDLAQLLAKEGAGVKCNKTSSEFDAAYAQGAVGRSQRVNAWTESMYPLVERAGVAGVIKNLARVEEVGRSQLRGGMSANQSNVAKFGGLMLTPGQKAAMALGAWTHSDTVKSIDYMTVFGLQHQDGCREPLTSRPTTFIPKAMVEE